ncbi:hypothetical protein PR048_002297 [Dryococelus australis]|uniref:Uncharacterized protein n=1 Tax=Dryococelus australis TaxID=614101 RepID=A0ABQ9IJY6_9NEOP|nr:hypothetical protein PR048_002297 [Dryococelus australis]
MLTEYVVLIKDYLQCGGHMALVENPRENLKFTYYLSHHGVIKDDSTTTRLWVFNASANTHHGVSLNMLLTGPKHGYQ